MELRRSVFARSATSSSRRVRSMNDGLMRMLRLIPPGTRGKTRLARLLMHRPLNKSPLVIRDRFGFRYEVPNGSEPIAFHLAIDGVYESETLALISQRLQPGHIFVDIGANIGAFTIPAARCVGKDGLVIAVEASADIFAYLAKNVDANEAGQVILL